VVPEILVKTAPATFSSPIFGNLNMFPFPSRISGTRKIEEISVSNEKSKDKKNRKNQNNLTNG
jgi:hypothetical protein